MKSEELSLSLMELLEIEYLEADQSFSAFAKAAWDVLEPDTILKWNWHHDAIAEHLEAVRTGQIKRLIINIPPRQMKSILVSVCFPAWVWLKDPYKRFICASYAQSLSTKLSRNRRSLIESAWYQHAWKDRFKLSSDQNVKSEFENDKHGYMAATSMLGAATGKGCNYLLIDDPHDTSGAESEKRRETAIQNFDQKFTTRLDNKKEDKIVVIMQRLHEKDLTGHLLKKGGYTHLCLPSICERKTTIIFPISKKEKKREEGDLLHPERDSKVELDEQRVAMGSYGFSSQHQQSPAPKDGGLFKRKWWKFYRELPKNILFKVQVWDCAQKAGITNDYSVCATWAATDQGFYLVDILERKMEYPQLEKAVLLQYNAHKPHCIVIEDKGSGTSVIQHYQQNSTLPIRPYNPGRDSKEVRAASVTPTVEAGNCYLPENEPWTEAFITQHEQFPTAEHDDKVDTTSMALTYLRTKRAEPRARLV